MFKILKYLTIKEWFIAFFTAFLIIIQVYFDLKLPDYMADITILTQTAGSEMSEIWLAGGKMLFVVLLSLICTIITTYFSAKISASISKTLRSKIFSKVEKFSMKEINKFSTASLITRSTNDVVQIQMFIAMGLTLVVRAPIMAIWAIFKIWNKGFEWTIATGIAVLFLLIVIGIIMILVIPKFKKMQELTDNINKETRENLTGLRVIRAYNAENYQAKKFEKANKALTDTQLFTSRAMALFGPVMNAIMTCLPLAIYWIGAFLITSANETEKIGIFSNMVVFSSYAIQVIMSFVLLTMIFFLYPRASVSAKRVNEVLETKISIKDGEKKKRKSSGEIELKNVSFKYEKEAQNYVLQNISFKAKQGETIAFIGSTGSGKSTLVNLIVRLYDATEGKILIDGVEIKDYELEVLHDKIAYIPQQAVLFKDTIENNISYGKKISKADLEEALKISQSAEFVNKMPEKEKTEIAQGAKNVSGGQKQRLSIARAIAKKPEIFIFDDTFSALDYKTDKLLRQALKKHIKNTTNLIVAQRISTIMDADQIIVLDEGKIVGRGTHKELLKNCEVYQQIARSQLSEEEMGK